MKFKQLIDKILTELKVKLPKIDMPTYEEYKDKEVIGWFLYKTKWSRGLIFRRNYYVFNYSFLFKDYGMNNNGILCLDIDLTKRPKKRFLFYIYSHLSMFFSDYKQHKIEKQWFSDEVKKLMVVERLEGNI